MRRLTPAVLLFLGVWLRAADLPAAPAPSPALPGARYFMLVETSANMKNQQDVALDTVNQLLLNGVNGRLRTNDTVTVWAYSDRLHTNVLNDYAWNPDQRLEVANRTYRLLRDLSSSRKPDMEVAMEGLRQATNAPGVLTAILVYSGSQPVAGTPFDNLVNEITGRHRENMRKSGKPFVTVFIVRDGRYLAHAVTPGGRPVFLPPLPKPPPKPAVTKPTVTKPTVTNTAPASAASADTNKPKPLSLEEIEESIRKNRKPTNTTSADAPPPAPTVPVTKPPPPAAAAVDATATNPPPPAAAVPQVQPAPAPVLVTPTAPPPALAPPVQPPATSTLPAVVSPRLSSNVNLTGAPRADGSASLLVSKAPSSAEVPSRLRSDPPARPVLPSAVVAPSGLPTRSWTDLATGVALLLAAAALAWVLVRNLRSRSQPSLISRSMDREKD
jgi:hypothetical protein